MSVGGLKCPRGIQYRKADKQTLAACTAGEGKNEVKNMAKATLNFANINGDALTMASNTQLAVNVLAQAERALQAVREANKGADKETMKTLTETERKEVKAAKDRAVTMATAFITRYIAVDDLTAGELYHFDMVAFLVNIGVMTAGDDDKKVSRKVDAFRGLVVDRVRETVARRKKGDDFLTLGETKEVKNDVLELFCAIVYAMVNSGAIEYAGGGLALKKFDK